MIGWKRNQFPVRSVAFAVMTVHHWWKLPAATNGFAATRLTSPIEGAVVANSSMKTTAFATSIIMRNITEDGRIARNVGAFSGKTSSRDLLKTG